MVSVHENHFHLTRRLGARSGVLKMKTNPVTVLPVRRTSCPSKGRTVAHLLVIESWVGSMSRLLPRALGESGHRFTFLTRDLHHYLRAAPVDGPHPLLAAENILTVDTNDAAVLLPYAERLHGLLGFDGVLSSCDYYLPQVARVAHRLCLPGAAPDAVAAACRKDLTRRMLAEAGVPGPAYALCADREQARAAARAIGYPLVVKPVDLCAGMFVREVVDETELLVAIRALDAFPVNARGQRREPTVLLEELLTGPEVSVETVSAGGSAHVVGITDKSVGGAPAFVETGHMFPAALGRPRPGPPPTRPSPRWPRSGSTRSSRTPRSS